MHVQVTNRSKIMGKPAISLPSPTGLTPAGAVFIRKQKVVYTAPASLPLSPRHANTALI